MQTQNQKELQRDNIKIASHDFTPMYHFIPEGKIGNFCIEHKQITKEEITSANIRALINPREIPPKEGTIVILKDTSQKYSWHSIIMSDTEFEKQTNYYPMHIAKGSVLIGGLGIGMLLLPLLQREKVNKITVVEKEKDIIELVGPHIKKFDKGNKLEIINEDIFKIDIPKETKFDLIYIDIWNNVCGDNYPQMKELRKKFRKNRVKGGEFYCWEQDYTKSESYE